MAALNLFRIFRSARSPSKTRHTFRPMLEALDARDVPAVLTWTDATGDDQFLTPGNWTSSDIPSGQPQIAVPEAGDDLLFVNFASAGGGGAPGGLSGASGPQGGSPNCYGMQSDPEGPYNSIFVTGGYTGTITVTGPVQTLALQMLAPATIDQPTLTPYQSDDGDDDGDDNNNDITVLTGAVTTLDNQFLLSSLQYDFSWTAGTINSTSNLSKHWLQESTANINPGGGSVTTGDNINLTNGASATFQAGTLNLANAGSLVVTATCMATIAPADQTASFAATGNTTIGTPRTWIQAGGTLTVTGPGTWAGQGVPLQNDGGTFMIQGGATASFTGALGPADQAASYRQTGTTGLALIQNGSTLQVASGAYLTGGKLATFATTDAPQPNAILDGNLTDTGADIVISDNAYNGPQVTTHQFATFEVTGNVNWSGGTYRPYFGMSGTANSDFWQIDQTLTVTSGPGGAAVGPVFVNANLSGNTFSVLRAKVAVIFTVGSPQSPNLPDGFVYIPFAGGLLWKIQVS